MDLWYLVHIALHHVLLALQINLEHAALAMHVYLAPFTPADAVLSLP